MHRAARGGVDPIAATMTLADYGDAVMSLAVRGLEAKTLDPYLAGWRKRVVPALGHLPVRMITNGAVDRVVHAWIADECSRSTVKNSLAMLVRVMEQAVRDGIIDRNPARVTGWQREYQRAEDELDDPRSLALPDWDTLSRLAAALVERSADNYAGWGEVVIFAACTAARIGEVSGVRKGDIDRSPVDLDRPASDHAWPRRADRQGDKGQAGPEGADHRGGARAGRCPPGRGA